MLWPQATFSCKDLQLPFPHTTLGLLWLNHHCYPPVGQSGSLKKNPPQMTPLQTQQLQSRTWDPLCHALATLRSVVRERNPLSTFSTSLAFTYSRMNLKFLPSLPIGCVHVILLHHAITVSCPFLILKPPSRFLATFFHVRILLSKKSL